MQRRIQRGIIVNVNRSSHIRYFCQILMELVFSRQTSEKILKYQISWKSVQW